MSMSPQPIKNLDAAAQHFDTWQRRDSFTSSTTGFNPLIYGNDVDSVDVATRVAMVFDCCCCFVFWSLDLCRIVKFCICCNMKSLCKRQMYHSNMSLQVADLYFGWFFLGFLLHVVKACLHNLKFHGMNNVTFSSWTYKYGGVLFRFVSTTRQMYWVTLLNTHERCDCTRVLSLPFNSIALWSRDLLRQNLPPNLPRLR